MTSTSHFYFSSSTSHLHTHWDKSWSCTDSESPDFASTGCCARPASSVNRTTIHFMLIPSVTNNTTQTSAPAHFRVVQSSITYNFAQTSLIYVLSEWTSTSLQKRCVWSYVEIPHSNDTFTWSHMQSVPQHKYMLLPIMYRSDYIIPGSSVLAVCHCTKITAQITCFNYRLMPPPWSTSQTQTSHTTHWA